MRVQDEEQLRLPTATTSRFLLIVSTFFVVSSVYGSFVYIEISRSTYSTFPVDIALFSVAISTLAAVIVYFLHPALQRSVFGPTDELRDEDVLSRIKELEKLSGVAFENIRVDRNICNSDAIVFGYPKSATLLVGRGLIFLAAKRPTEFDARIAHELAHVKFNDHTLALASRSALLIVKFLFALWLVFRIKNIVSDMNGSGFTLYDISYYDLYQWMRWLILNIALFLIYFLPHALFWTIVTNMEYRSVLRSRELYADRFSAALVGPEAIKSTLSSPQMDNSPEHPIPLMLHHPSRRMRRYLINEPHLVGQPNKTHFIWIGFLTGALLSTYASVFSDVGGSSGRIFTLNEVMGNALDMQYRQLILNVAVLTLISIPHVAAAISMTFRQDWHLITQPEGLVTTVTQLGTSSLCVGFGFLLGDTFAPHGLATRFADTSIVLTAQFQLYSLFSAVVLSAIWLAISMLCCLPLFFIKRGKRTTPIRRLEWILLSIFIGIFFMGVGGLVSLLLSNIATGEQVARNAALGGIMWVSIGMIGLLAMGAITGRIFSRKGLV